MNLNVTSDEIEIINDALADRAAIAHALMQKIRLQKIDQLSKDPNDGPVAVDVKSQQNKK